MASRVKRFIKLNSNSVILLLFLGLLAANVKGATAQMLRDEVVSLQLPFELTLKKTGSVRLAGLLFDAQSTALSNYIQPGDKIHLKLTSSQPDRYGRKPIHLYDPEGHWVQGELVRNDQATPYPYAGEENFIRDLYLLEHPKSQSALSDDIARDHFSIVQGTVIQVANVKGTTYLNFGDNWRTDFTISIQKKTHRLFKERGFALNDLKGKMIRIRGWVLERNGPMIEAHHPSQIEIVER